MSTPSKPMVWTVQHIPFENSALLGPPEPEDGAELILKSAFDKAVAALKEIAKGPELPLSESYASKVNMLSAVAEHGQAVAKETLRELGEL